MDRRPYSETDIAKIREMRGRGQPFSEIATAIGRNKASITSKYYAMGFHKKKNKKVILRKAKSAGVVTVEQASAPTRPMIALVGTQAEVTTTIRELFS